MTVYGLWHNLLPPASLEALKTQRRTSVIPYTKGNAKRVQAGIFFIKKFWGLIISSASLLPAPSRPFPGSRDVDRREWAGTPQLNLRKYGRHQNQTQILFYFAP